MRSTYYLVGCGGHSRSIADVLLTNDAGVNLVFIDPNAAAQKEVFGFPVVENPPADADGFVPAAGPNERRARESEGRRLVSVVASNAHIGVRAEIGDGVFVGSLAHIGPETKIGRGAIVNTSAVVEHNCRVGEFAHIAPGAVVCGGVMIGERTLIGARAVVKPNLHIVADVVVGAGAVVVDDIAEPGSYVGCPARKLI